MKATWLLLVGVVSLPMGVRAQVRGVPAARDYSQGESTTSRNTGFGLKGGISWGDLQSGSAPLLQSPFERLRAFEVGAYWQYGFTHFASVQAELLYARQGFRGYYNNLTVPGPPQTDNRLDYLLLPVLLVGNLTETISLHLGPQAGVLLAARTDGQALDLGRSGYQRFDLGGVIGAEARVGPARVGARAGYSLPVLNRTGTAVTTDGLAVQVLVPGNDYHNLVLQAYLGVGIAH